jgi:3D (Asp-Asp-Asp) domain-containing protein/peptidoglycan hydrolase CwlO-like protein
MRMLCVAVLATTAFGATLASVGSAETAGDLEQQARDLRSQNADLASGSQSALQELAAIEIRLDQTQAELASFRSRAAVVRGRRREVNADLQVARSSVRRTRSALARRLQALYEQETADPLAVILGAGSLSSALNAVETLEQSADQDEELLRTAGLANKRLARLNGVLAGRQRELEQLAAARAAAAASLADARAEKLQTIAALQATSRSNSSRIAGLEERARTLASVVPVSQSASAPAPAPVPGAPRLSPGPASGVVTMTVVATGYALPGRTASGASVGWGAVAVDPSVIPMGSRLSIPGYGLGVAADTGGAIQGSRIDLWFPSAAEAYAWGSRVVTITVYSA